MSTVGTNGRSIAGATTARGLRHAGTGLDTEATGARGVAGGGLGARRGGGPERGVVGAGPSTGTRGPGGHPAARGLDPGPAGDVAPDGRGRGGDTAAVRRPRGSVRGVHRVR